MKRKLWIAAWAALLLALLSTAALAEDVGANGYTTYSIAYNLTGMTAEGQPTTAVQGTSVDITLTTASGYETPDAIAIAVGGKALSQGTGYSMLNTGSALKISIPSSAVTGDIVVTATAAKAPSLSDNADLSALSYGDPVSLKYHSLTQAEMQQAASADGIQVTLPHGNRDGQFTWLDYETADPKAKASENYARLQDGKATSIITVTAEDGVSKKRYTIHFTVDPTHDWGDPVWSWSADLTSATATFTCQLDTYHVEQLNATITSTITNSGCVGNRIVTYTATVEFGGAVYKTDRQVETRGSLGHDYSGAPATCTTPQICAREGCGVVLEEAKGHVEVTVPGVAPTCTSTGLSAGKRCAVCGEILVKQAILPMKGHAYKASTIAPTCTEGGYTKYTCANCGASYTTDETNARGHYYGEWSFGDGAHSALCQRTGCEHTRTVACESFAWRLFVGEAAYDFAFCPVCGEANDGAHLSWVEEAGAEALTKKLPRGETVLRVGALANGEAVMSVGFEYSGELTQPAGEVKVTLPAALLEGYTLTLLEADGSESELPFAVEDEEISFTLDFAPVEDEEPVPVRVIRLIPVAG